MGKNSNNTSPATALVAGEVTQEQLDQLLKSIEVHAMENEALKSELEKSNAALEVLQSEIKEAQKELEKSQETVAELMANVGNGERLKDNEVKIGKTAYILTTPKSMVRFEGKMVEVTIESIESVKGLGEHLLETKNPILKTKGDQ